MTESTKVWASIFTADHRLFKPITVMPNDRSQFEPTQDELDHQATIARKYREALIKDADILPKTLTGQKLDTKLENLPNFFIGAGYYVVSQTCAEVFQRFDLGDGGFAPVTIYQGDRKSFISEQQFYILYFGCQKQVFMPDLSNPAAFYLKTQVQGGYLRYSGTIEDGDCVLSAEAVEGPRSMDRSYRGWCFLHEQPACRGAPGGGSDEKHVPEKMQGARIGEPARTRLTLILAGVVMMAGR